MPTSWAKWLELPVSMSRSPAGCLTRMLPAVIPTEKWLNVFPVSIQQAERPGTLAMLGMVPFGGHTLGSVGIFVNLSPTRRFFYVRDSVDDEPGFENRVGKALLLRDSDDRPALADRIVRRLSQLHEMASVGSATACWRFS